MTDTDQEAGPWIDLPKILNGHQVQSYLEDGYLAVPDLVSEQELANLKTDIVKLALGGYPADGLDPMPPGTREAEVLGQVLCIHQPHFVSPVIRSHVKHTRICGALSQITAAHLADWDGSVKCMQSMFFVKPPGFQGQAWHQDEVYIPTRDRSLVGAWTALDDATVENGCLWILPGSHRRGYLYPKRPHQNTDEFDTAGECYGFDDCGEVPVEVKAGTVVFFNGYLLHRSRKNRSRSYRRVLVNHYMNAWSFLPWQTTEDTATAEMDNRCIVPVAGTDPYAWKGTTQPPKTVTMRHCKAHESLSSSL